jgi:hypothetical protein
MSKVQRNNSSSRSNTLLWRNEETYTHSLYRCDKKVSAVSENENLQLIVEVLGLSILKKTDHFDWVESMSQLFHSSQAKPSV